MGFHDKRESISGFHDDKNVEEPWFMCIVSILLFDAV